MRAAAALRPIGFARSQLPIAFRRAGLAPELCRALFLVVEDFTEAGEIGFRRAQLLLGVLPAGMKAGDARGFLEQEPALDGFCGYDRADLSLADQRRRVRTGRGVGEEQGDVLGAHVAAVDPIG